MTEDSSLFGSRSRADTLRSASATRGDAAVLQLAANSGNLSLTEASVWRISVQIPGKGNAMATRVNRYRYTSQGFKDIKDTLKRVEAALKATEAVFRRAKLTP
jgi:hypothetical protein